MLSDCCLLMLLYFFVYIFFFAHLAHYFHVNVPFVTNPSLLGPLCMQVAAAALRW